MLVAIAGPIASGKTSLAHALATTYAGHVVGFGDYVRRRALERDGSEANRATLQELGQRLVEEDADKFVEGFLLWGAHGGGGPLLLDGLRHLVVWRALGRRGNRFGVPLRLIYVDAPFEVRARRTEASGGVDGAALATADLHPSEKDVNGPLAAEADLILDGRLDTSTLVRQTSSLFGRDPASAR